MEDLFREEGLDTSGAESRDLEAWQWEGTLGASCIRSRSHFFLSLSHSFWLYPYACPHSRGERSEIISGSTKTAGGIGVIDLIEMNQKTPQEGAGKPVPTLGKCLFPFFAS